jgi:hypothetical protein
MRMQQQLQWQRRQQWRMQVVAPMVTVAAAVVKDMGDEEQLTKWRKK